MGSGLLFTRRILKLKKVIGPVLLSFACFQLNADPTPAPTATSTTGLVVPNSNNYDDVCPPIIADAERHGLITTSPSAAGGSTGTGSTSGAGTAGGASLGSTLGSNPTAAPSSTGYNSPGLTYCIAARDAKDNATKQTAMAATWAAVFGYCLTICIASSVTPMGRAAGGVCQVSSSAADGVDAVLSQQYAQLATASVSAVAFFQGQQEQDRAVRRREQAAADRQATTNTGGGSATGSQNGSSNAPSGTGSGSGVREFAGQNQINSETLGQTQQGGSHGTSMHSQDWSPTQGSSNNNPSSIGHGQSGERTAGNTGNQIAQSNGGRGGNSQRAETDAAACGTAATAALKVVLKAVGASGANSSVENNVRAARALANNNSGSTIVPSGNDQQTNALSTGQNNNSQNGQTAQLGGNYTQQNNPNPSSSSGSSLVNTGCGGTSGGAIVSCATANDPALPAGLHSSEHYQNAQNINDQAGNALAHGHAGQVLADLASQAALAGGAPSNIAQSLGMGSMAFAQNIQNGMGDLMPATGNSPGSMSLPSGSSISGYGLSRSGGAGGTSSSKKKDPIQDTIAQLMAKLNPAQQKAVLEARKGTLVFGAQGARTPATVEEDRSIALFERISLRYRSSQSTAGMGAQSSP